MQNEVFLTSPQSSPPAPIRQLTDR